MDNYGKRPLSLPSLRNPDPTSPIASCCACSYLSKSTGDIFGKKSKKNFLFTKRKWSGGSSYIWSVFRKKESLNNDQFEKTQSNDLKRDVSSFGSKDYLRTTSWTFVQNTEPANTSLMKPHFLHNEHAKQIANNTTQCMDNTKQLGNNTKQVRNNKKSTSVHDEDGFTITPTYQSCTVFAKKQKAIQNSRATAVVFQSCKPQQDGLKIPVSRKVVDQDELRVPLLRKTVTLDQNKLRIKGML